MSSVQELRTRVENARRLYAEMPRTGRGQPGPADEKTGESWDRGNVLGHVSEMVPFWTAQARALLAGAEEVGRGEAGYQARKDGVESADRVSEQELHDQIQAGIAGLDAFLGILDDLDLDRRATYHARTGDRQVDLRTLLEEMLVGHLEEHARQLYQLGTAAG